mmetsp:Transcript_12872/g.16721  ORF Transcript_12872/g.16721 Transcript_12872/m.16721 type:complete len:334 (+) Transcript_12872:122-1123(+)|eukprot:CAMPEP_0204872170 /NCGR_PEP_ID=MMETSP1348-20121228/37522_1 /ASSEMBLY_ACC=CAM_ASM_000700 /TAXON_ID=215587 /ORGANISM="Aplanochytrium stocchinoi, Strain GSBS06" /LENGTH=333 /DNA_ID=CAMNT_0052026889 /DNA_START=17 /DNA_END=1018 /DNA_ORIENTATION=+
MKKLNRKRSSKSLTGNGGNTASVSLAPVKKHSSMLLNILGVEDPATPRLEAQHMGYLSLKNKGEASWKLRFCVVKDGFFIYYMTESAIVNTFSQKPRFVIPLNGAYVGYVSKKSKLNVPIIEIIHEQIKGAELLLKFENQLEAADWLECLKEAKKATWENAQYGAAKMKKLEEDRQKAEKEKNKVIEDTMRTERMVDKHQKQKTKAEERARRQDDIYSAKLERENELLLEKIKVMEFLREDYTEAEKQLELTVVKRKKLQNQLNAAKMLLHKFEARLNDDCREEGEEHNNDHGNTETHDALEKAKNAFKIRGRTISMTSIIDFGAMFEKGTSL